MRKYNAIKNAVNFAKGNNKENKMITRVEQIKPVSEMTLITPRRNTKWLEKDYIYEVVSEQDIFGYFKVIEPRCVGGRTRFIHKNNMKRVNIVQYHHNKPAKATHNKENTMIKNITITLLTITLLVGTLYHNTTVNTLQDKYDKTCVSSVKKSNRISQLVKQSTSDTCSDCGFLFWSDSWCEHHMGVEK